MKTNQSSNHRLGFTTSLLYLIVTLTLTLSSTQAGAAFQGVAGEALLVPFVVYDPANGINTTVRIKIPAQVGVAMIPNELTAQHTTPNVAYPPPPAEEWRIFVTFVDANGLHRLDFMRDAVPNSVITLDWGSVVDLLYPTLRGLPGYLVIQTESGHQGEQADFNMFGDALMAFSGRVATIPVLPMSDGEDSAVTDASEQPSLENQVINYPSGLLDRASPLASGILTGSENDILPGVTASFDLTYGRRRLGLFWGVPQIGQLFYPTFKLWEPRQPTLLVVWNDRHNPSWGGSQVTVYDNGGNRCSNSLSLDDPLNLFWVGPPGAPAAGPNPTYIQTANLCFPTTWWVSSGYVNFELESPQENAASAAFSIIFSDNQATTVPAHERGRFGIPVN
jgi:hypothetical protein